MGGGGVLKVRVSILLNKVADFKTFVLRAQTELRIQIWTAGGSRIQVWFFVMTVCYRYATGSIDDSIATCTYKQYQGINFEMVVLHCQTESFFQI